MGSGKFRRMQEYIEVNYEPQYCKMVYIRTVEAGSKQALET